MDINLVMTKKDGTHRSFGLPSPVTVIGRRRDCELCIPLMVISRRHCELDLEDNKLKVRDLGSKNGTLVNGDKIDFQEVKPGDVLTVGPINFTVQINGKPSESEITANILEDQAMRTLSIDDPSALSESQALDATTNGNVTPDFSDLLNNDEDENEDEEEDK